MIPLLSLLIGCASPPETAPPLAYDRAACESCGMMVSEPRFAAQLATADGQVYTFDDPACMMRYIVDRSPSIANAWFRDSTASDEVWLSWLQVAFVPAEQAPMDGGFAAVPVGTPGALSFGQASAEVITKHSHKETP